MRLKTKSMGMVDVPDEHVIQIPAGLFGFEEYTEFALIDSTYQPLVWLQSTQEPALAFLAIDPFLICDNYETDIDDKELLKIDITEPSQVLVLTLVTVPRDGTPVTANLLGPLIVNKRNRHAMQVVLNDAKWTTKHDIVRALKGREAS